LENGYIVENTFMALGAVAVVSFACYQLYVDYVTNRAQHWLLKSGHFFTWLSALFFGFIQMDPKALYGLYTITALNFVKNITVVWVFVAAQCVMVAWVYALTKSNLGKKPVYLVRALLISSVIYLTVIFVVMIIEAVNEPGWYGGITLVVMAVFVCYLLILGMYSTTDLKRTLQEHQTSKMAQAGGPTQSALKRIRNIQIIVVIAGLAGTLYQLYVGVQYLNLPRSLPKPVSDPLQYSAETPFANIITLGCIVALQYCGYYKKTPAVLKPSTSNLSVSGVQMRSTDEGASGSPESPPHPEAPELL